MNVRTMTRACGWWVIVVLTWGFCAAGVAAESVELIRNPGFEEGQGALPDAWTTQTPFTRSTKLGGYRPDGRLKSKKVEFSRDTTVRRSGKFSAHIRIANGPGERGNACWVGAVIAINPEQQYLFRMRARTLRNGFAYATFFEYDAAGKFLSRRLVIHPKLIRGTYLVWQQVTYLMGPDLWNPKTARIRITLNADSDKGKVSEVWFDDVSLVRLDRRYKTPVVRYTGPPNKRMSQSWYEDFNRFDFDPKDEAAVRRYIDDSLPKAEAEKFRRRNILFYHSFDGGNHRAEADFAEGLRDPLIAEAVRFEEGRFGKCVHVTAPNGKLRFRGSRNLCAQRGTVAYWFKTTKPQSFSHLRVTAASNAVWANMFSFYVYGGAKRGAVRMWDAQGYGMGPDNLDTSNWKPNQWIHFAAVWDENFGIRAYVNGKQEWSSWGKRPWEVSLRPSLISLGSGFRRAVRTDVWFDELYIFGETLTDDEVVALYHGRAENVGVRQKPYVLSPEDALRRLRVAGINRKTPLAQLTATEKPAGKRLLVRVCRVETAKQQTTTNRRAVDGVEGCHWPQIYFRTRVLDVYLEAPRRFNYVALSGRMPQFKLLRKTQEGTWTLLAQSERRPARICRFRLPLTEARGVRYEIRNIRNARLGEIRFAEVTETSAAIGAAHDRVLPFSIGATPADFGPLGRHPLDMWKRQQHRGVVHGQERGPMSRSIVSLCTPEDRTMLVAAARRADGEERSVRLGRLQRCQLFSSTFPAMTPVDSVTLRLRVSRLARSDVLRLLVREPSDHFRNIVKMDLRVTNPAGADAPVWLEMTLDIPDQVILPGQRLWIEVALANGAEIFYGGAGASQLILSCPDPDKSKREFVTDQARLVHNRYRDDCEAHPWDYCGWEVTSRRYRFTNEEIYLAIRAALTVDPKHRRMRAYWSRMTHRPFDVKLNLPDEPGAPEWAVLQRELFRGASRIVHWWIANRQMPDGQLGGSWNDDVETAAVWPPLALIAGDEKVARSLEKIADGLWFDDTEVDREKGYTIRAMDVEHAHEPTVCSQPHMMVLRYGDPEYIERNMRAARNLGEWTAINPQGLRLFRSWLYNAKRINTTGFAACDVPYNCLNFRPADYIAWYNRNPLALKWIREHGDAWLKKCLSTEGGKPRGLAPQEIVFKTGKIGGFSGHWSKSVYPGGQPHHQFLAAYCLLGDRRFLDYLLKYGRSRYAQPALYRRLAADPQYAPPILSDTRNYVEGMKRDLKRLLGTEPLVTWAEPSTDRIGICGYYTVMKAYLGTMWGRAQYPIIAATYEDGGDHFVAHVLDNTPKRLKLWLYNFKPNALKLGVRVWFLESGTYRVSLGPDANNDGRMDGPASKRTLELARHSRFDVTLPRCKLQVLRVDQIKKGEPIENRADVAIGPRDIEFDAKAGAFRVTVHNVGSTDARDVVVHLIDARGRRIAQAVIPLLRAPLDLTPKTAIVTLKLRPGADPQGCAVVLDPQDAIIEITEHNNRLVVSQEMRRER